MVGSSVWHKSWGSCDALKRRWYISISWKSYRLWVHDSYNYFIFYVALQIIFLKTFLLSYACHLTQ